MVADDGVKSATLLGNFLHQFQFILSISAATMESNRDELKLVKSLPLGNQTLVQRIMALEEHNKDHTRDWQLQPDKFSHTMHELSRKKIIFFIQITFLKHSRKSVDGDDDWDAKFGCILNLLLEV